MVNYKNGSIVVESAFHEASYFDVANNRISAQFDGRGAISKYSVMNKFSVFSNYYSLYSINDRPLDFSTPKKVEMKGRQQIITFSEPEADFVMTLFLDNRNSAIYVQTEVKAKTDLDFRNVINFGINYESYVQQLLANRLSAKTIGTLLGGFIKTKKNGLSPNQYGASYIRGDILGDFYLDIAVSDGAKTLEAERGFINQFSYGGIVRANATRIFRYVISAGTRTDYTFCDVNEALENFSQAYRECLEYNNTLQCPIEQKDEFKKAYYASLLNSALANYKELDAFKGFLAGIVYQFPARTYYRDAYWTVLAVLPVKPELVRNEIITLAMGINNRGECPSAVKFNFKNYWGNHYDSPSFFVMMLFDYLAHTKDFALLDYECKAGTVLELATLVMDRLAQEEDEETGMLIKGGEYNRRDWCDNVFRAGFVTYDEALYARALYCLGQLHYKKNNKELGDKYSTKFERVKKAINDNLWDEEKGYYINYTCDGFVEDNLSIDTVIVALFNIADESRAKRMLENMEKLLESKNNKEQVAGDFGTLSVWPFYKNIEHIVQKSSLPYYYHNGGDWPYWSCIYAYAKLMYGMEYEYPLTRWFEYNIEKKNYTPIEFFSPFHKDGSLLQAWSSTGAFVMSYPDGNFFKKEL